MNRNHSSCFQRQQRRDNNHLTAPCPGAPLQRSRTQRPPSAGRSLPVLSSWAASHPALQRCCRSLLPPARQPALSCQLRPPPWQRALVQLQYLMFLLRWLRTPAARAAHPLSGFGHFYGTRRCAGCSRLQESNVSHSGASIWRVFARAVKQPITAQLAIFTWTLVVAGWVLIPVHDTQRCSCSWYMWVNSSQGRARRTTLSTGDGRRQHTSGASKAQACVQARHYLTPVDSSEVGHPL